MSGASGFEDTIEVAGSNAGSTSTNTGLPLAASAIAHAVHHHQPQQPLSLSQQAGGAGVAGLQQPLSSQQNQATHRQHPSVLTNVVSYNSAHLLHTGSSGKRNNR